MITMPGVGNAQIGSAVSTTGSGCQSSSLADVGLLTVRLGDTTLGLDAPHSIVIDRSTNTSFRTPRSLNKVHRIFVGTGDCPDTVEPAEIVPRDGTWIWRQLGANTTGCPTMMATVITAGLSWGLTQSVAWGGAFHSDRFAENLPTPEMGEMSPYCWRRIGRHRWLSDNLQKRGCDEGTCVDFALTLSMTVVADTPVSGLLTTRSRVQGCGNLPHFDGAQP